MSVQRRTIQATLPDETPESSFGMNSGMRLQPNYSLNSIQPNTTNPRRPDLENAGITVDVVKTLAKTRDESVEQFEDRIYEWIRRQSMPNPNKEIWHQLLGLALSIIKMGGVLQPIVVHIGSSSSTVATLTAGERRFLASWLAGMEGVNAIVKTGDETNLEDALVENTQRDDLSLNALIGALRAIQHARETTLSVRDIVRLSGHSRGSAGVIHQVLTLDDNHPAMTAIINGSATRVYHLSKLLKPGKMKSNTGGESSSNQTERTDDTNPENEQSSPSDNKRAGQAGETAHPSCPNLDTPPDTDSSPNRNTDSDNAPSAHNVPSREHPGTVMDDAEKGPLNWVSIKAWLMVQVANSDHQNHYQSRITSLHDEYALARLLNELIDHDILNSGERDD